MSARSRPTTACSGRRFAPPLMLKVGRTDTIGITNHDERCSMVNFDPGSARATAEVLKVIVRVRNNKAGVYGTVTRRGRLAVRQPVYFEAAAEHREHL